MDPFTIIVGSASIAGAIFAAWQVRIAMKPPKLPDPLPMKGNESLRAIAASPDESSGKYLTYLIKANSDVDPRGVMQENHATLKLDEIYVTLLAVQEEHRRETWLGENQRKFGVNQGGIYLPGMPIDSVTSVEKVDLPHIVRNSSRVVILGDPGAGKTTLIRFLTLQFALTCINGTELVRDKNGDSYGSKQLPIPLRIANYADALRMDKNLSIRSYLSHSFDDAGVPREILSNLFDNMLNAGQCYIFLDGLDEVIDAEDRNEIARHLDQFVAGLPDNNRVLVTSRIAGYYEARLGGDFEIGTYTLWDMNSAQIGRFLTGWCYAYERFRTPNADSAAIERRADDEIRGILKALNMNEGVQRLAKNPLLLTVLALIHRNGASLPNRRVDLYELASKTLLSDWQLSRGISRRNVVQENEALRLLGPLAYWMHENEPSGLIAESKATTFLINVLCNERAADPNNPPPEIEDAVHDFLRRVREHTGLFVERSVGQYGFMHLTFEEYFAGRELVRISRASTDVLHKYLGEPRWEEPLRLAIGYVSKVYAETASEMIRNVILEGKSISSIRSNIPLSNLLFAAHCIGDCFDAEPTLSRQVAKRLVTTYLRGSTAQDWVVRVQIGNALNALSACDGGIEAEQLLLEALKTKTSDIQWKAAEALGSLGRATPEVLNALMEAQSGEETSVLFERASDALQRLQDN